MILKSQVKLFLQKITLFNKPFSNNNKIPDALKKVKIKNITECTGFTEAITIKAEIIAIPEKSVNKKNSIEKNIFNIKLKTFRVYGL